MEIIRTLALLFSRADRKRLGDRWAKTIVFCVDQPHAQEMMVALNNLNTDLTRDYPNYVCRITSDEGKWGRARLDEFKDVGKKTPVIAVTSQLLSTGVDVPTCKNVVLVRVIRSMVEFKQIIGRGSRVRPDYNKLFFTIVDYTNSSSQFADPNFEGFPDVVMEATIDDEGDTVPGSEQVTATPILEDEYTYPIPNARRIVVAEEDAPTGFTGLPDDDDELPRKYYYDGGQVEIAGEIVHELDPNGHRLRTFRLTDYTGERVRTLYRSALEVQQRWVDPEQRLQLVDCLADQGIDFEDLKQVTQQPQADPFDLLCYLAFGTPPMTCKQRAERLKRQRQDFFAQYGESARAVLNQLLDRYAEEGPEYFTFPDAFKVKAFEPFGNVSEIAARFGGPENLRAALDQMQSLLYTA